MKMKISLLISFTLFSLAIFAQQRSEGKHHISVPIAVKNSLAAQYPQSHAYHVVWEKEHGNYEANWGGKDGEANSVQFTPKGTFIEIVREISVHQLPKAVLPYLKNHYKHSDLGDIGIVEDAKGITTYEVEIHGKDVIFDESGNFLKAEK